MLLLLLFNQEALNSLQCVQHQVGIADSVVNIQDRQVLDLLAVKV